MKHVLITNEAHDKVRTHCFINKISMCDFVSASISSAIDNNSVVIQAIIKPEKEKPIEKKPINKVKTATKDDKKDHLFFARHHRLMPESLEDLLELSKTYNNRIEIDFARIDSQIVGVKQTDETSAMLTMALEMGLEKSSGTIDDLAKLDGKASIITVCRNPDNIFSPVCDLSRTITKICGRNFLTEFHLKILIKFCKFNVEIV